MLRTLIPTAAILATSLLVLPALAGDLNPPAGAVAPTMKTLAEVEPRVAINPTNTPGDPDSIFKITQPGSYYLPGPVSGVAGDHAIQIDASDVTIDLMGHTLDGGGVGFNAVYVPFSPGRDNIVVRNGIVRGFINGVSLDGAIGGRVEGIHASDMLNNGITLGRGMVARDCTSLDAAGHGFTAGDACRFIDCVAAGNGFSGFITGSESSFEGCVAEGNGADGFTGSDASAWSNCTARENTGNGFTAPFFAAVLDCVASANGAHGIFVATQATVRGNQCSGNGTAITDGAGILSNGIDCRIDSNNCVANDIGIDVLMSGNLVVRNSASGNTSGNYDATITNTSSDPSTAGAWDNLSY